MLDVALLEMSICPFNRIEDSKARFHSAESGRLLNILFEDQDILVVNKPAGLVCHPTRHGPLSSLIGRLRVYLGEDSHPQFVNRLDRETSGIVVIAKNSIAAQLLRDTWQTPEVVKEYLGIVKGHPMVDYGCISARLGKHPSSRVAIRDAVCEDGLAAVTHFEVKKRFDRAEGEFSLLLLRIETGRKHQIRIHLQHLGHPLVGDKIYGGDEKCYLDFISDQLTSEQKNFLVLPHQALHATRLRLPWRRDFPEFIADPENWFREFCQKN